jgi:hypothetical protein
MISCHSAPGHALGLSMPNIANSSVPACHDMRPARPWLIISTLASLRRQTGWIIGTWMVAGADLLSDSGDGGGECERLEVFAQVVARQSLSARRQEKFDAGTSARRHHQCRPPPASVRERW